MASSHEEIERRFNEAVPLLKQLIEKRRSKWMISGIMDFEDASSIVLTHLWKNFSKYDPARPLDRWANTVITRQIQILIRNVALAHARPCITATPYGRSCVYNLGGDRCGYTCSGVQDNSCPLYAAWEKKKRAKFAVSTPLSIENHRDEANSKQSDFVDMERAKRIIDEKISGKLTKEEFRIYHLLYIKNLEEKEVGKRMGYKRQANSEIPGYLMIRSTVKKIIRVSRQIMEEEGLC